MRLSSTAKTWGCSPFSITHFAEEEPAELASICSISLPNNNNNENFVQQEVINTLAIKETADKLIVQNRKVDASLTRV